MRYGVCQNPACPQGHQRVHLRKDFYCYKCNPIKSAFKPKTGVVPGAKKTTVREWYNDHQLFTELQTLQANKASFHEMVIWLRNGDYSRQITKIDMKRILDGKIPKSDEKRRHLRLLPYSLKEVCPICFKDHRHLHHEAIYDPALQAVHPKGLATYNPATERVFPAGTEVKQTRGKPDPRRRVTINNENMASAARSLVTHLPPARVRELVARLSEMMEG